MAQERPILFTPAAVRALLAGTKTETLRMLNPQPPKTLRAEALVLKPDEGGEWFLVGPGLEKPIRSPFGGPGDRLWVRETFRPGEARTPGGTAGFVYAADEAHGGAGESPRSRWKPSIHMPRAASRLLLEVTGLRVERLKRQPALAQLWEPTDDEGDLEANPWMWVVGLRRIA